MTSICLSCILFTLEGNAVEKNRYFSVFLMWLSQLVLKGDLQPDDKLIIQTDTATLQHIQPNLYFNRLLAKLNCTVNIYAHKQPKTLLEGMMWKYNSIDYSQDIFMYCDIDTYFLKPIHSFTDKIEKDSMIIHIEDIPLSDPFFGAAFTDSELEAIPQSLKGINAGKFIIKGKDLQQRLYFKIWKLHSEIDGSEFSCCDQPFFNKAIYLTDLDCKIFSENDIFFGFRTDLYSLYEIEKDGYFLYDCCGNAGDGEKHYQMMFHTFLMLHAGIF